MQRQLVVTSARASAKAASSSSALPPNLKFIPATRKSKTPKRTLDVPSAALSAFAHRIGLGNVFDSTEEVQQVCTHPSFSLESSLRTLDNAKFAAVGNSLLGLFASEFLHASYPHLPTRVMKAAVSAQVGPMTCANVAREMGATSLLRWNRTPQTLTKAAVLHTDALASIPRALTGFVYQRRSLPVARKFAESFFLNREVDLRSMIKFQNPKHALVETVRKFKRERPISRILKETGRYSNSPMFVVGIFSGSDQLGEGFGSSLKMAEYRAAEDSLLRLYLTRQAPDTLHIPSSTFSSNANVYDDTKASQRMYLPGELGETEVVYGSAGRTGQVQPRRFEGGKDVEQGTHGEGDAVNATESRVD